MSNSSNSTTNLQQSDNKLDFMRDGRSEQRYLDQVNKFQQRLKWICPIWSKIDGSQWVVTSQEITTDYKNMKDLPDMECIDGRILEVKETHATNFFVIKSYQLKKAIAKEIQYLVIWHTKPKPKYIYLSAKEIARKLTKLPDKLTLWNGKGDYAVKFEDLEWLDFIRPIHE